MSALLSCSAFAQTAGFITVDQFGYRPTATKNAVLRDPQLGLDASAEYTPSAELQVIDSVTGTAVFTGSPVAFSNGATDAASGDKIWWFDFSSVTTPGRYYIYDAGKSIKSYNFSIKEDVYNEVLKHAIRMFFYQRVGYAKTATHAGAAWADGASHVGARQDLVARAFLDSTNVSTARDVSGGWYDAGDYNKYTSWTSNYIEQMLLSYLERPEAFTDDYNIPESGNSIPDIVDEAKWGMDHLLKLQNSNGSMISVIGLSGSSPPSNSKGASYYGGVNSISGWAAAKAFALGAQTFSRLGNATYAKQLTDAAIKAWAWSEANPNVIFHNNNADNKTSGLAAGDQEDETDYNRLEYRSTSGLYLYELTGDSKYLKPFEDNYSTFPLFAWSNFMDQYRFSHHLLFLRYITASYGNASIKSELKASIIAAFNKSSDFAGMLNKDGYRSFIKSYNWGSNKYKADYGITFGLWKDANLEPTKNEQYITAAEDYIHYIHGTNPFDMVYLTNMNAYGASNSLKSIYHTWFSDKSAKWDEVGKSTYGPAPGYLAGGPNASFKWDKCCAASPRTCGSVGNNALCDAEVLPVGAPPAKMYKDFNTNWPLNSWEITEPSNGYQMSYIRLLARFVEERGQPLPVGPIGSTKKSEFTLNVISGGQSVQILSPSYLQKVDVYSLTKNIVLQWNGQSNSVQLNTAHLPAGVYFVKIKNAQGIQSAKFVKN